MDVSQSNGGTRSGLLWEVERILCELDYDHRPNVLIMENVPQIHSEKDYPNFEKWMIRLEQLGYCNFYTDLNAKNFGIPQNRERCFMVSIKGQDWNYKFPKSFERELNLKDMLQPNEEVAEKYYLSKKMMDYLTGINQKKSKYNRAEVFERNFDPNKDVAATITTAAGQRPTDNFVIEKYQEFMEENGSEELPEMFNPYNKTEITDIAPAQTTQSGSTTSSATVLIVENTEAGFKVAEEGDGINISSRMHHQRGNVQKGMAQTLKTTCEVGVVVDEESLFTETEAQLFTEDGNVRRYIGSDQIDSFEDGDMATTTFPNGYGHGSRTHKGVSITLNTIDKPVVKHNLRIRKLTPKEAGRLMAFQDIDTDRMYESGLADASIFHCYGDSICVNVLIGIICKLYGLDNKETKQAIKTYIRSIIKNVISL